MRRPLVRDLDDVLAEVGLDGVDPDRFERLGEVDLLRRHRLRFHRHVHPGPPGDVDHHPTRRGGCRAPVHGHAPRPEGALEPVQPAVEVVEGLAPDRRGPVLQVPVVAFELGRGAEPHVEVSQRVLQQGVV